MSIDSLTTEEAARLRDARTIKASYVQIESGVTCKVEIAQGMVFLTLGGLSINLTSFSAVELAHELGLAGIECQCQLDAQGLGSEKEA